ncbi:MAG: ABC transporter ATP-binding protein [Planctomycetes bacterium]|nr:ABC transporter ATP-binding protein [Planctomycetota bacterium]
MIRAEKLRKTYRMGEAVVHALDGVDVTVERGEFVSIVGASGSGKSTLMHILGCLDRPTSGTLEFEGHVVSAMNDKQLARVRNQNIGFVFQTFNLINRTSALDNVLVPQMYTRRAYGRDSARRALERVGLAGRANHTPSEMSGGECQRVAIARAIVNSPQLLLADEPTGNLDSKTGEQIMGIFHELHAEGITVVLVTHEMDVAVQADRMIQMRDGRIVEDTAVDRARRQEILHLTQDAYERMFRSKRAGYAEPRVAP